MATLSEIKKELNVETLGLDRVLVQGTGEPTAWFKYWNNTQRIAILVHEDTLNSIKGDANISNLGIHTQMKAGEKGEYTAYTIVMHKPAEVIL